MLLLEAADKDCWTKRDPFALLVNSESFNACVTKRNITLLCYCTPKHITLLNSWQL
jgi:hypothetical protein